MKEGCIDVVRLTAADVVRLTSIPNPLVSFRVTVAEVEDFSPPADLRAASQLQELLKLFF